MKVIPSFMMKAAVSLLFVLVNIISIYLLLRGHNFPGGGFIAGLMTGTSFILLGLVRGWTELQRELPLPPLRLATFGLSLAILTGALPLFWNRPFMTQYNLHLSDIPFFGNLHIGTPLVFDFGVFLLVSCITVKLVIVLARSTSGLTALTPGEARYYASALEEPIEHEHRQKLAEHEQHQEPTGQGQEEEAAEHHEGAAASGRSTHPPEHQYRQKPTEHQGGQEAQENAD